VSRALAGAEHHAQGDAEEVGIRPRGMKLTRTLSKTPKRIPPKGFGTRRRRWRV
jgi:hypothetical protein